MTVRFEKVAGVGLHGGYVVWVDGVVIGTVYRWSRRYNLVRVVVSRGWRARPVVGPGLPLHANGC